MEPRPLSSLCLTLVLALAGCVRRPSTTASPEPSLGEAAEGMILQTYYILSSPSGDRVAMRRCTYVDRSPDRCEITFVVNGRIVERVPTYLRAEKDWLVQGRQAVSAVEEAVDRHLGKDRVALTRLGIFGAKDPPEGRVAVVLAGDRVELVSWGDKRVLAAAPAPPGVVAVDEGYRSERAPDLYAASLTAETPANPDRQSGFVVFHRRGPGDFQAVAVVPPIDPKPVPPRPPPAREPPYPPVIAAPPASSQPVIAAPPAPSERVLQVPR